MLNVIKNDVMVWRLSVFFVLLGLVVPFFGSAEEHASELVPLSNDTFILVAGLFLFLYTLRIAYDIYKS